MTDMEINNYSNTNLRKELLGMGMGITHHPRTDLSSMHAGFPSHLAAMTLASNELHTNDSFGALASMPKVSFLAGHCWESASLGAMRALVWKLDMLLQDDSSPQGYSNSKRIKDGMCLLKDDVEEISSYLEELSEVEDPPPMAKCWMNEARDLSYDMEDYIDSLLFVPPDHLNKNNKKRKKMMKKNKLIARHVKIPKRPKWCKQITCVSQLSEHGKISSLCRNNHVMITNRLPKRTKNVAAPEMISEFRIYIQDAIERHNRYKLNCCSTLRRIFLSSGSMLPAPYEEAAQIVIDGRMHEFMNSQSRVADDDLRVVSVLGYGCLGKTTLAKALYNRIGSQFDCRAFIRVSKKPDMKTLFCNLFLQLHQKKQPLPVNCNVLDISDKTSKHLQDKRYLIVIDDLWDVSVWDIIKNAFPKGNCGSRIIITTQVEDVALTCCCDHLEHVFEMKPLDDDHSRKLFCNRLFGYENDCPVEFKQVSNEIIDICGGLPLATINIATHLANQQTSVSLDLLTYTRDWLRSHLWSSSTSERTRQVLELSYNNLPHHLKTFLLYLHMYPEGSIIWKDDLVKQWVAEGFIDTRKWEVQDQETIEKAAGIYFDELIDRRFIQPLYINYNNKVLSCTVHDVVRDLIAQKSAEENFIVVLDYNRKSISLAHKVRRLSLVFRDAKYAKTPANITKSQVRSLTFCGLFKCMPCIREFKVLRVLNLQLSGHFGDNDPIDLTGISELFQLKYLKIASDVCIKLPNRMRGLQCLETLDVMDVIRVTVVPWDIMYLPHLLHLSLPVDTNLLDWICSMSDPVISLSSLGKLNYLQDLYLTSPTHPSYHPGRSMEALGSLIGGHGNLKTIVVAYGSSAKKNMVHGTPKVTISWDRMAPPPLLQRFECSWHSYIIFYRIPRWVKELGNLRILKIAVKELQMICVGILRGLRALTALSLYVEAAPLDKIIFDKAGFSVLKHFKLKFMSGIAWLKFEADGMPNLWNLKLVFNAIPRLDQDLFISSNQASFEAYQHGTALINIEHMPGLKEISAKFGGAAADVEYALRNGISNHPSNPAINVPSGGYSSYCDKRANQKQQPDDKRIARSRESSSRLHVPDSAVGRIAAGCGFEYQIISDYVGFGHVHLPDIEVQAGAGRAFERLRGSGFGFGAGGEQHGAGSNPIEQHSIGNNLIEQNGAGSNLIGEIGRELSIRCLLHLSRSDYGSVASLNRDFNLLVRNGEIYRLRRHNGVVEHWVYFFLNVREWVAYDLYRKRWIKVPKMPPDEFFMCSHKESLAVGTELLVFGNGMPYIGFRYSILTNSWGWADQMNSPRCLFASASASEKAYVAGGTDYSGRILSSAEMYNSETHTWTPLPSMNRERKLCSGVFMDGKFYVIGGVTNNNKGLACGEEYDLNRRSWTIIENMCEGLNTEVLGAPLLIAVLNNELYAADYRADDVKRYDKMNNRWITLGKLPQRPTAAVNGWDLAFRACGDRLIVVHVPWTYTRSMVEFHSWIPGPQPPMWSLVATRPSESSMCDCVVMGC